MVKAAVVAPTAGAVCIDVESDIVAARRTVREIAIRLGFSTTDTTRIVTAASELARNIFRYAGSGKMCWRILHIGSREGLELSFIDSGPGISDILAALNEGFTTGGGLGMGLPGAKRLMDEMEIRSTPNEETCVTVTKWRKP